MRHILNYIKKYPLIFSTVIIAFIFYMFMVFPSGTHYCIENKCGIYFWGVHSHDAIWHFALVEAAFNKFPFLSPTFSGALLTGYNYLYDLFLFILSKIGFSPIFLFFKLVPILWFIAFVLLLILVAKKLKNNVLFVGLFLFFSFFASSFSYLFTLYHDKTILGSAGLLSQLPGHMMLNPQFALSLLGILYILLKTKSKDIHLKESIIFGIIVFINLGLKFYGGVVTLFLVGWLLIYSFILKDIKKLVIYGFVSVVMFLMSVFIFYNPFTSIKSGSIFVFAPFSIVHPITEDPSLFYLQNITNARYFLLTKGIGPKLIAIETLNLTIFLFFYLGVRFFGLFYILVKIIKKKITVFDLTVISTMICATAITVLVVQKAEWWNTIQFFYYAIFLSTFYITELSYEIIKKFKIVGSVIVVLIMIIAIPATLSISEWSFHFPGNTYLSDGEREALQILKKQKSGVVYTPIYSKILQNVYTDPIPLYASGDNAYVTAFSGKQSYIADILQLRLTGVDYQNRLKNIENSNCDILKEIDYVYYNNDFKINRSLFDCPIKLDLLFANQSASVFKVMK